MRNAFDRRQRADRHEHRRLDRAMRRLHAPEACGTVSGFDCEREWQLDRLTAEEGGRRGFEFVILSAAKDPYESSMLARALPKIPLRTLRPLRLETMAQTSRSHPASSGTRTAAAPR